MLPKRQIIRLRIMTYLGLLFYSYLALGFLPSVCFETYERHIQYLDQYGILSHLQAFKFQAPLLRMTL